MTDLVPKAADDGLVPVQNVDEPLPELHIRRFEDSDSHEVKEFCLNNLMQRTRLSNAYVYRSPLWLAVFLSGIAWATNKFEPWKHGDWGRWAFLCCAISALCLVSVDYFTYQYYESSTQKASKDDEFLQDPAKYLKKTKAVAWIAIYNGAIAGTILLRPTNTSSTSEIGHWYVRARYRDKGLGSDLLHEAIVHAQKHNPKVTINTTTSTINSRANKSLRTIGFTKSLTKQNSNLYWRALRIKDMTWTLSMSDYKPQI